MKSPCRKGEAVRRRSRHNRWPGCIAKSWSDDERSVGGVFRGRYRQKIRLVAFYGVNTLSASFACMIVAHRVSHVGRNSVIFYLA